MRSTTVVVAICVAAAQTTNAQTTCNDGSVPSQASYLGDGNCDSGYSTLNSYNCNWDFGDCCEETCVDGTYSCADTTFSCEDPNQSSYYVCKQDCYSQTCDYYVDFGYTCDELENTYGCSCAYCECPTTTTTTPPACYGSRIGDGYCDTHARGNKACNTADFDWDGGDCCPSTCDGTYCGYYGYDCQDPAGTNDVCNVGTYESYVGDGYCETWGSFNTPACNWDEGDCCGDTCESDYYTCGQDSLYNCKDPYSNTTHCAPGFPSALGDGACDTEGDYNTAKCNWDHGDCCESTCVDAEPTGEGCTDTSTYNCDYYTPYGYTCYELENTYGFNCNNCDTCETSCGSFAKLCLDPRASDYGQCESESGGTAGDGICNDDALNSKGCQWDGGDCCADTCEDPERNTDGCTDTSTYNCDYYVPYGYSCSELENTYSFDCTGCAECVPPCAEEGKICRDPESTEFDVCEPEYPEYIGDLYCDSYGVYNTKGCDWDGGDCCEESCIGAETEGGLLGTIFEHTCNSTGYSCLDPEYSCQGAWTQWTNCDADCGGGLERRTFIITQNATTDGQHCVNHDDVEENKQCNTAYCDEDNDGIGDPIDSCVEDAENDADNDLVCGNLDDCPYDALDDEDGDNLCGDVDDCPIDPANDFDGDQICADEDSCAIDPENDADGDNVCDPALACPDFGNYDDDSDDICNLVDSCAADAGNDYDSDLICSDVDSCPYNADNDADFDGICDIHDDCVAFESRLGDGYCDSEDGYNTDSCNWDGGDCCAESCRTYSAGYDYYYEYYCTDAGTYDCQDPKYAECGYEYPSAIGDGWCDSHKTVNNAKCNWDGGDCCSSTCVSVYYACGYNEYDCEDPEADNSVCTIYYDSYLGDGYCDYDGHYNTEACGWDGGDCCSSSCTSDTDGGDYSCGHFTHFDCLDPENNNTAGCSIGYQSRLGDGICDMLGHYNSQVCGWDGGDCCPDTCGLDRTTTAAAPTGCGDGDYDDCDYWIDLYPASYTCAILQSGYGWDCTGCLLCAEACADVSACKDENSENYGEVDCAGVAIYIRDGICDQGDENTEACNWDGGDCCPDTCVDDLCEENDLLYGHVCLDPNSTEYDTCDVEFPEYIGDAMCDGDEPYNTEACNWDGGDCCPLTCFAEEDNALAYECGELRDFNCQDPQYRCFGDWTQWTTCDATCNTGTRVRTFLVSQNATDGGAECEGGHDEVFTGECNTKICDEDGDRIEDSIDSCPHDPGNDDDGDLLCGNEDLCPFDAENDADNDGRCGDDDDCPYDPANDYDGDAICGSVDSCPEDPENDADGDQTCEVGAPCAYDNDDDSDEICSDTDSCPFDAGNDIDSDMVCDEIDSCPMDGMNDIDNDGICDLMDECVALEEHLGNGICDAQDLGSGYAYNSAGCNWDGGDCCSQTCRMTTDSDDQSLSCDLVMDNHYYNCTDPLYAACEADYGSYVGDGYCDDHKRVNTRACNWDGGDCCSSTCDPEALYQCGMYEYSCLDPDANMDVCNVLQSWVGDGYCDAAYGQYNTPACDWDGGDCCSSSCDSSNDYGCGHYSPLICLDPNADNSICEVGFPSHLGDGVCDPFGHYNTFACNWDEGDCCPDTCAGDKCGNVTASCADPLSNDYEYSDCEGVASWLGDGYCDLTGENTLGCDWDGGDCCADTCVCEGGEAHCYTECGENGYLCEDPSSSSYDECGVEFLEYIGDAFCDAEEGYNTEACDWDGGDCCAETCSGEGTLYGYDCDSQFTCANPVFENFVDGMYGVVSSGMKNQVSDGSSYSVIAGGVANQIYNAEYANVLGGYRNVAMSKYSNVLGGFESQTRGKLSTVAGGSRNTASGRHSLSMGYKAYAQGVLSYVAAFNGEIIGDEGLTNIDADCATAHDKSIKFCADDMYFNGIDLLSVLASARRLSESSDRANAVTMRIEELNNKMEARRSELLNALSEQDEILAAQAATLA